MYRTIYLLTTLLLMSCDKSVDIPENQDKAKFLGIFMYDGGYWHDYITFFSSGDYERRSEYDTNGIWCDKYKCNGKFKLPTIENELVIYDKSCALKSGPCSNNFNPYISSSDEKKKYNWVGDNDLLFYDGVGTPYHFYKK